MHLYGGSGKHSKKKPEKGKKYEEYDYDAGYGEDYDYEDYDYEPAPRQSHSRNAGQTRKTEPKPRRSEPQRRSRRRDSEDIRSTNRTVYGGNGYDYEDDLHFASDAYISPQVRELFCSIRLRIRSNRISSLCLRSISFLLQ